MLFTVPPPTPTTKLKASQNKLLYQLPYDYLEHQIHQQTLADRPEVQNQKMVSSTNYNIFDQATEFSLVKAEYPIENDSTAAILPWPILQSQPHRRRRRPRPLCTYQHDLMFIQCIKNYRNGWTLYGTWSVTAMGTAFRSPVSAALVLVYLS